MSTLPTQADIGAAVGRCDYIRNGTAVQGALAVSQAVAKLGAALGPGTYTFLVPIAGNDSLTIINKPTAVTGAVTATVVPALADGSADPTATPTSLTLAANTANKTTITGLGGAQYAVLTLTVPGGGSIDFTNGLFEYRAY